MIFHLKMHHIQRLAVGIRLDRARLGLTVEEKGLEGTKGGRGRKEHDNFRKQIAASGHVSHTNESA